MGFKTLEQRYKTVPLFLLSLYALIIFVYLLVLVQIMKLFREAYPQDYEKIKVKFISFLIFYEIFIMFRAVDYYLRQYGKYEFEHFNGIYRGTELSYYIIELIFIALLSYVGYKNMKNENNQEISDSIPRGISQNVRNSFMAFSDNSLIKEENSDIDNSHKFDDANFGKINPSIRLTNDSGHSKNNQCTNYHDINFSKYEKTRSYSKQDVNAYIAANDKIVLQNFKNTENHFNGQSPYKF